MPADRAKVKAALDSKFRGKSVTKELKDAYAARAAEKLDSDDDIQQWVDDMEGYILDAAKDKDTAVTNGVNKARKDAADAINGNQQQQDAGDNQNGNDSAPDNPILKLLQKMDERMTRIETGNAEKSIAERIKSDARTKDIPEGWMKGKALPTAENFETWADEQKADFSAFATTHKLQGFGNDAPGGSTTKGGSVQKEASKEQLDALMDTMKI